jgi:aminopeptidase-like protein
MKESIEHYFDRLWPICRSITGNGLRESFHILREIIPLQLTEVPTGTKCFDWEVPREWNIRDAYITTPRGEKIAQFKINNLHVLNYSVPVNKEVSFDELKQHLHFLPSLPDAIPYVTSYYRENWGFCISYNEYRKLPTEGNYKVFIDSDLAPGHLTYGDLVLPGESEDEVLFSSYLCHPSMANNELSGPLCMAFLYQKLLALPKRKYTYRFVLAPETIGVIAYLAKHGMHMREKTVAGFVLTCCGDAGDFVFKMSKLENSLADRVARHVLKFQDINYSVIPFAVGGSDERQYCSPGFNMPVASLTRSMYQRYPAYHTSLDNKEFISFDAMEKTIDTYFNIVRALELNDFYVNTNPFCEPQLGKRGMYLYLTKADTDRTFNHRLLHLLTFADGTNDLVAIAEKRNESVFHFESGLAACIRENLIARK